MAKIISYLKKLRFDPKLNNTLIAKYLRNPRMVILLVLLITISGVVSLLTVPRVLNPSISIPIVIVTSSLPGANPQDVEQLVTIPIEDSVAGLAKIDTVTSTSQDSSSVVEIQFLAGVNPDKAQQDVQNAVAQVTGLPKDATTPRVQKLDFEHTPVWSFSISSSKDTASLMQFGQDLQTKLKDLSDVDSVSITGIETQEIQIIIKPEAIATYQLNPQQLAQAINAATSSYPAGSVTTNSSNFSLAINADAKTVAALRSLRINVTGPNGPTGVLLTDVATIVERSKPDQAPSYLASSTQPPARTIRYDVYKTDSATITQTVTDAKKLVNNTVAQYGNEFQVNSIIDTGQMINQQFSELIKDMLITVSLVFIILLTFLGFRQAIVASLAIPLTFFIVFTIMNVTGISLSFIAFFSLLLSLGLLVDDTVVVSSAMTAYYRTGRFTPIQAGLLVWRDFLAPVFTTTITTVWAFLPLLLASGIIGDFIKPIPIVVSSALLGSFLVAMFITLPLIILLLQGTFPRRVRILVRIVIGLVILFLSVSLLPKNKLFALEFLALLAFLFITYTVRQVLWRKTTLLLFHRRRISKHPTVQNIARGVISFEVIGIYYRRILNKILSSRLNRRRIIIMVVIFSLFSYLLVPLGLVRNEFFPQSDANYLFVNVELPAGTNTQTANAEALRLLNQLRKTPDVTFVSANIGLGIGNTGQFSGSSTNNILFSLVLPDKSKRHFSSIDIAENLRQQYKSYSAGTFTVTEESGGPPAGADVQIKLFGNDLNVLNRYADKIKNYLKTQPGLTNIDKSIKPGTSKLVFVPDKQKLLGAGLTNDQLGFWLRTYASGEAVEKVQFDDQNNLSRDITIRTSSTIESVDTIDSVIIPTANGNVPLSSLGTLELQPNPTVITREKGKRTISITASVRPGYSVSVANANLEKYANSKLNLPDGYSWSTGGVNQQNQESVTSILKAMVLSFLLILITMVLQFNSFRRALIVMLVIPLSISGVFIIFALTHTPLSFPALIGVLALFGIVVKNSILIVDKIVHNLDVGIPFKDSVVDGAESRLEPIALTSMAAIVGLLPITLSNALWQGLGGAIIAGLTFSGTIMLFFIPVVYYIIFRPKS